MTETEVAGRMTLAEAAREAGVHHLRLLRVLREAGVVLPQDADGSARLPLGAVEVVRRRTAAERGIAGAEAAPLAVRRLLEAMLTVALERDTALRVASIARATGRYVEALAIEEGLRVAADADVLFDDAAGCWRIALPRPLPSLDLAEATA